LKGFYCIHSTYVLYISWINRLLPTWHSQAISVAMWIWIYAVPPLFHERKEVLAEFFKKQIALALITAWLTKMRSGCIVRPTDKHSKILDLDAAFQLAKFMLLTADLMLLSVFLSNTIKLSIIVQERKREQSLIRIQVLISQKLRVTPSGQSYLNDKKTAPGTKNAKIICQLYIWELYFCRLKVKGQWWRLHAKIYFENLTREFITL